MANQSNPSQRLHSFYSWQTLSCLITLIILLQGPIIVIAQINQFESVIAPNNNVRSSSTSTTVLDSNDDIAYSNDIYDDGEDGRDEMPSSTISTTASNPRMKEPTTSAPRLPAQTEEVPSGDYGEESYQSDEVLDSETTNQDDSQQHDEKISINDPFVNTAIPDSNNRKGSDLSSTSRLPFVPSNLWRELFSKPGILVGIIGGVVIGMLSAILLVMFIIYRMRKKDEGSYALEEGPRKSPSHAYTRVSSREFFA